MKSALIVFTILALVFTGCQSFQSDGECRDGICIDIDVQEPVEAGVPAPFTITLRTDQDMEDVIVHTYSVISSIFLLEYDKIPASANNLFSDSRNSTFSTWSLSTTSGEEYFFTGHLTFPKPENWSGAWSCSLYVEASDFHRETGPVSDHYTVYFDPSGKQIDEEQGRLMAGTPIILPTFDPSRTVEVIADTPMPTVDWSTATPIPPRRSPTVPPYPYP